MVQHLVPESRVVKSFTIYGYENFQDNSYPAYNMKPVMMFCGNDAAAKSTVAELIAQLGWEPLDVGGLDASWVDKITFSMAPSSPLGATLNRILYFTGHVPTLSGNSLIPTGSSGGARVTFTDIGGGAGATSFSFVWNDVGTAGGYDWVMYDNFSFSAIPEPSSTMLLILAGVAGILLRRKGAALP